MKTQAVRRHGQVRERFQNCVSACDECVRECERCAEACSGTRDMVLCLRACRDCAELCRACTASLDANLEHTRDICLVCARVCDTCTAECEKHQDEPPRRCAEACRRCASECRQVAAGGAREGRVATRARNVRAPVAEVHDAPREDAPR